MTSRYDPFARGLFPAGVRTIEALDTGRDRRFTCEIWYPAAAQHAGQDLTPATQDVFTAPGSDSPKRQMAVRDAAARAGTYPLIAFSHSSGGRRRQSTFLCTHLASHGYVVAAVDHSETFAPEFARKDGATPQEKAARIDALIACRVPDIRFLLDRLLDGGLPDGEIGFDPARVGIVGHSFGGWTALAAPDSDHRIGAVVALAPGGASNPKPGIIPCTLNFRWARDVPTLYLAAENDVPLPLDGMFELYERTPATKHMVILRRADHLHFMDDVEQLHETVRATPFPGDASWIQKEMRPIVELCSGEQAYLFVRGLTLCHLDAFLKQEDEARLYLAGDLEAELKARGVDANQHKP